MKKDRDVEIKIDGRPEPRMLPLDEGRTYVDPREVVVVKHDVYYADRTRKERKAGWTRDDAAYHSVTVRLRNGEYVNGLQIGRGLNGVLAVSVVMEQLIEAVG